MSNYTQMPPHLADRWNFGGWDNRKSCTPPWQHRGFWYHDESGRGDRLVIAWKYSVDEGGYEVVTGHIHRFKDMITALKRLDYYRREIDENNGYGHDGVFIFFGDRRLSKDSVHGKPLPPELLCLPDNRWL